MMKRLFAAALAALIATGAAAQQIDSGTLMGNSRATAGPPRQETVTALLDRAFSAVNGTVLCRAAGAWNDCAALTLGIAGSTIGTLGFAGNTSGTATITPQAAAGTPTLTLPNTSGTFAVGATSPLVLSATTGMLTCATCVTSSGGGAITGTAPVAVSGAGAVSITGAAGQVLAGASPAFTNAPTLGVAGSLVGSVTFANATSGSVTIQPVTGALGTQTISLPAATGTVAVSATSPITLSAAGAVGITGSALTRVDDTNVTLTLGGTPTTALINAASITAGWTGTLSMTRGGSAKALTASNGGIVWTDSDSMEVLSGTATANQALLSGSSATPAWSTATYPATASAGTMLAAASANTIAATATPTLGANGGTGGQITFSGSTSGSAALRVAAAAGTSTVFQLPASNGTSGYVLQTDGSGNTSWIAVGGTGTMTRYVNTGSNGLTVTGTCDTTTTNSGTPCNIEMTSARRTLPTTQKFLSGSGTYTTPANVLWIEIHGVGGGGGGGGHTAAGGTGGNTCWNTSGAACTTPVYQAGGGGGGGTNGGGGGGAGGTVAGSGTPYYGVDGAYGDSAATYALTQDAGGSGCNGGRGGNNNVTGGTAPANSGGGGGGSQGGAGNQAGGGGGCGAQFKAIINSPAGSYTYAIGAAGTAGTGAGTVGAGGSGGIWVIEHYGT